MNAYRRSIRPILFRFDPEQVHQATLTLCHALGRSKAFGRVVEAVYYFDDMRLRTSVAGINFPNPVGLGAGFLNTAPRKLGSIASSAVPRKSACHG